MPVRSYKVGPGTLKLGETGTATDFTCQFTDIALEPDKDSEDALKVLCGDTIPGDVTYKWTLTGTAVQDITDATSINLYSMAQAGNVVPFEFSPRNGMTGFKGNVTIDPLKIGGEVGKTATADFEWEVNGLPQVVPVAGP